LRNWEVLVSLFGGCNIAQAGIARMNTLLLANSSG